ncbi:MAG: MFS transporter [Spirochaetales bacterium]|nr:MFS transporter [Spirochaetales bacterium]
MSDRLLSPNAPPSTRLPPLTKILYGSADTGFSLTTTLIGAYLAIFLTDVVGVAPGIAAAAIFVGRSWDYVNDPIVGHISDRTRTRWGRRRPYLLFASAPFAAAFAMLWWKPPFESDLALAAYFGAAYLLFDTAATFAYMPYFALTPELTSDYDERTSLTSYRMFFSIFASLLAFTVPLFMIGSFRAENASKVLRMGVLFGLVSAAPLLLAFFATRERQEYMEQEPPRLGESLKAVVHNRPFLLGLGLYLFTWLSIDMLQAILLYFLKYCVRREAQSDLIMATIFVTAIAALPLWNWLARRWDKRRTFIVGIAFWALVQLLIITLGPSSTLGLLMTLCVLAGLGVGAAHVLPWSILPDAIEWDEWKTGERHEGMFYSIVTLAHKVASSVAIPLILLLLQVSGYQPNVMEQGRSALLTIRLITGPIPAVFLGAGILCAVLYPLTRKRFQAIVTELEQRRAGARRDGARRDGSPE